MTSLGLRFTTAETPGAPPELGAFLAVDHALLREQEADHDDVSGLADLLAATIVAGHLRVVSEDLRLAGPHPVFVRLRSTGIPALDANPPPTAITAFLLRNEIHGHLAWPQRGARTGALVLAACIPLAMPDFAHAQQPAPVTTPVRAQPAPAPAPVPVAPTPEAAPVLAPTPPTSTIPHFDTILQAMNGRDAIVFVGATRVTGKIIGIDGDFVTMIDAERDGKIAMIPKLQITEVRGILAAKPVRELSTGNGNLIAGGVLVGVGTPLMIAGLVLLAMSPSSFFYYGIEIIPAAAMLGVGIPQIVIGKRKQRAYRAAQQKTSIAKRLLPAVQRTPHGSWTGGLSFRF